MGGGGGGGGGGGSQACQRPRPFPLYLFPLPFSLFFLNYDRTRGSRVQEVGQRLSLRLARTYPRYGTERLLLS